MLDADVRVPANLPRFADADLDRLAVSTRNADGRVSVLRQVDLHLAVQPGLVESQQLGEHIAALACGSDDRASFRVDQWFLTAWR